MRKINTTKCKVPSFLEKSKLLFWNPIFSLQNTFFSRRICSSHFSKRARNLGITFWYGSALWYDPNKVRFGFWCKFSTVHFYSIELKLYQKIPKVIFYVGVNFQVNQSLERTCDIGQNELYEFCYLFSFDLWTSYLARILFLKECGSLF
jgi:hypothetical protein